MTGVWKAPLLAAVMALSIVVTGCGGDDDGSGSADRDFNQTDAAFAPSMLPHHEAGVELGMLAAQKGTDPQIKKLGQGIVEEQGREVKILEGFISEFDAEPIPSEPIEKSGMMDMKALMQASGEKFDELWLAVISAHHAAAIQMAQIEAPGGKSPEARKLAKSIIRSQSEELKQFNELVAQMDS